HGDGFEPPRPFGILGYNQVLSAAQPTMRGPLFPLSIFQPAVEMAFMQHRDRCEQRSRANDALKATTTQNGAVAPRVSRTTSNFLKSTRAEPLSCARNAGTSPT